MVTHKTKGIVLRTVRYGETSVIAAIYTELFGLQSYLVNGVRVTSKKGSGKANLLQPCAILDLVVYHNEMKNLQRIKEFRWGYVYESIFFNVFRNSVALFMIELLQRSLKQPEPNPSLFNFVEDAFIHLDKASDAVSANFPLYFAVSLSGFYGFRITDRFTPALAYLDLEEGKFSDTRPSHMHFLEEENSRIVSDLLKVMQPSELSQLKLNQETRRVLLHALETFYALHIEDFGKMKTLPVLEAVLS
ncbi:MAG: DNA repair protein RecO [Chitinophagaceae bacterium]|nr:DNA repair protein RecO [Chitinophagaceae bacterium]